MLSSELKVMAIVEAMQSSNFLVMVRFCVIVIILNNIVMSQRNEILIEKEDSFAC